MYNRDALARSLQDNGMEVAEDVVEVIVKCVIEWIIAEAARSPNTWDDALAAVLKMTKGTILDFVDKIDGEEG